MSRTAAAPPDDSDLDLRRVEISILRRFSTNSATLVLLVDVALIAVFSLASRNHVFWSIANVEALLRNGTEILVLALGVTVLMSAAIFDLSVGANLVLASVLSTMVLNALIAAAFPPLAAILGGLGIAVAAGIAFGVVNGLVITKLRVNSLITTLGTLGIGAGAAQLLTNGQDIEVASERLSADFALVKFGFMPLPMLCALVLSAGVWLLLRYTRFGMRTLAIGSNQIAALRAGIEVQRHIILLTAFAGAFAGFAGFVDVARLGATAISSHDLDGLSAVTAVVIGGTALAGGRASVLGSLWGAALSVILLSGLIIIRMQPFWQLVATGIVLIAAVAIDQIRTRQIEAQ